MKILGDFQICISVPLKGSRTSATEENCPPDPNSNTNPKPNPNPNRGAILLRGNCPDTPLKQCKNHGCPIK